MIAMRRRARIAFIDTDEPGCGACELAQNCKRDDPAHNQDRDDAARDVRLRAHAAALGAFLVEPAPAFLDEKLLPIFHAGAWIEGKC